MQTGDRDGHDGDGDIFGYGDQPDFGFEGFGHDDFGFDFGEGFSHDDDLGAGHERQYRQDTRPRDNKDRRRYKDHHEEYEGYEGPEYEDDDEESYRKVLILKNRGQFDRKRNSFDFGF